MAALRHLAVLFVLSSVTRLALNRCPKLFRLCIEPERQSMAALSAMDCLYAYCLRTTHRALSLGPKLYT
jgi:hypothetical protein